ncbi:hypothetical protein V8F33_000489 [Rhypophila sp. PSN 637]
MQMRKLGCSISNNTGTEEPITYSLIRIAGSPAALHKEGPCSLNNAAPHPCLVSTLLRTPSRSLLCICCAVVMLRGLPCVDETCSFLFLALLLVKGVHSVTMERNSVAVMEGWKKVPLPEQSRAATFLRCKFGGSELTVPFTVLFLIGKQENRAALPIGWLLEAPILTQNEILPMLRCSFSNVARIREIDWFARVHRPPMRQQFVAFDGFLSPICE